MSFVLRILTIYVFNLETWSAGNGYVGSDAANYDEWIDRVYKVLQENRASPKSSYTEVI
jgi:hypothetical protein